MLFRTRENDWMSDQSAAVQFQFDGFFQSAHAAIMHVRRGKCATAQ